jgi:hypothetical protein
MTDERGRDVSGARGDRDNGSGLFSGGPWAVSLARPNGPAACLLFFSFSFSVFHFF